MQHRERAKWQLEKPLLLNHADAQSLFNLLCLKSECIFENIHGCLQAQMWFSKLFKTGMASLPCHQSLTQLQALTHTA